ncbi:MAG: hypothetical protein ACFCUE_07575 [Candidatus Bathyarchaeia archaeon]|jgi:hypothetical protein
MANLLYFNAVKQKKLNGNVILTPNFFCPTCKNPVQEQNVTVPDAETINFNQPVTFTIPCCNQTTTLYVAIHKSPGGVPQHVISTEPIMTDWWVHYT